jgi:hypothetical protein
MSIKHKLVIVWLLLIVYTLPVIAAVFVYAVTMVRGLDIDLTTGFFKWLSVLAENSDSQLNLFHKVLLPVVAGVSAYSFSNADVALAAGNPPAGVPRGLVSAGDFRIDLLIFCIVVICVVLVVVVGIDTAAAAGDDSATKLARSNILKLFGTISEYMGVYLMLLLGLKAQA